MEDKFKPKSKRHYLLVLILFLGAINYFLFRLDWQNAHRGLTFAMLDIGQGDALFIESPTGAQILFDAGPVRSALDPLRQIMSPFDRNIDAIVLTNPDADHIGGFSEILDNYEVGVALEPGTTNGSKTYQNLKNKIEAQKIPNLLAKRGMKIDLGAGAVIEILFPDRDVSLWERNDGSIVARLVYGDTAILLTGDATEKTEKIILAENAKENLRSDILKVGHHGSRTSTSRSFVQAVAPRYALISDGKDNKYGHPHKETLSTLAEAGVEIFRTDLLGTIIFKCAKMGECEIKR